MNNGLESKPEDIRSDEPETRITDVEKAQTMAEVGHTDRSVAAFERQLAKILKSHKSGELSREELESATKELMSVYPEDHETPFSEYPNRHEHISERADQIAEKLENWTGILLEHPAKGWTAEMLANKERSAINCDNMAHWVEKDKEKVMPLLKEKGFVGIKPSAYSQQIPKEFVINTEDKIIELTKNPETTIRQLLDVVEGMFDAGIKYWRDGAKAHRDILDKIKEGISVSEPAQEEL